MEKKNIYHVFIRKECRSIKNDKIVKFDNGKMGEINGIIKTMLHIHGGEVGAIQTSTNNDKWRFTMNCTKDTYDKIVEMIKMINDETFPDLCVNIQED